MSTRMIAGMELERDPPQTLVKVMSDRVEVNMFDNWRKSNGAVSISPSLATPVTYDEQRSIWRHPGSQEDFESAINHHLQRHKHGLNSKSFTWEGVLEQLDNAITVYHEKSHGNPARAMMRKGEAISRSLIPLLEAIPNDNGLGLLKGGLLVIFNAVKRRSEACEKVFHCFRLVPERICRVHELEGLFPHDKGVKSCIDDFYSSLTASIPQLIRILNRNPAESRIVRMGKHIIGDQVKDVDDCIKPVNEAGRKLDERVRSLERYRDAHTARTTDSIHSSVNVVRSSLLELGQDQRNRHNEQKRLLNEQKDFFNERFQAIRDEYSTIQKCQIKELRDEMIMALNAFYRMTAELGRTRDLHNEAILQSPWESRLALPHTQAVGVGDSPTMRPSIDDLLEALGGKQICLESLKDHGEILRKYHQFSDRALRQAAYLKSTSGFQRWLGDLAPMILLVDGHDTRGRVSAMSVFCSMLVQALGDIQKQLAAPRTQSTVLFFTCGAHTQQEDILAGPCGIVRSLVGQLLVFWPGQALDLSFMDEADTLLSDVQENRIEALCYLFQELLRQLPSESVVYCVIDGLSTYETRYLNRKDDLGYLVEALRDLTSDPMYEAVGPVLKVLLASADKSTDVYRLVPSEDRVDLRAQNQAPSMPTERSFPDDIQHTLQSE